MKWCKQILLLSVFLLTLNTAWAQQATMVTGKVIDKNTKEALIGASIGEIDANNRIVTGVITNIDGEYAIQIKNPKNKIQIDYIGYKKIVMSVNGRSRIDVQMEDDENVLTEVTVTASKLRGTGGFKLIDKEVSSSMQRINASDFEGIQVASVGDALQGRISGLDIVSASGNPGSGTTMKIRGTSSVNINTQPLIVLNGVVFSTDLTGFDFSTADGEQYANLLNVNPDDIEELEVLKDGASTAIYGSQGANGVIRITTKRGRPGPPRVQYTYRLTRSWMPEGMNLLNGDDYTMLMKQSYFNVNNTVGNGNIDELNYRPNFSEYQMYNNNTDWVKAVTQTAWTNNHYLSVSGGGERAAYRVSAGYQDQSGTVIGTGFTQFSATSSFDYIISDRLKVIADVNYIYTKREREYNEKDDGGNGESYLSMAYRKMPNLSIYTQDKNGNNLDSYYNVLQTSALHSSQKDMMNPVALANLSKNKLENYRITPTIRLQFDLLDPMEHYLRYNGYIQFDTSNDFTSKFLPKELRDINWYNADVNRAYSRDFESMTTKTENEITWQPNFMPKNNVLMLNAKFQTTSSRAVKQIIETYGLPNGIEDPTADGRLNTITSESSYGHGLGFAMQANYSFMSKYILYAMFRIDGSTRFGKDNKYGTFPAFSARWNIIDEKFMDFSKDWLSMLALRASYGITGNQPGDNYLYFSRYASYDGGYAGSPAIRPVNLQLTTLRWEKVKKLDLGLNLGFLDDKITVEVDIYDNLTKDLLMRDLGLVNSSGYSSLKYRNGGDMRNTGWELAIRGNQFAKINKFSVSAYVNFARNTNKYEYLTDEAKASFNGDFDYKNGSYMSLMQLNNPTGSIYGFRYKGVYQYSEYIPGQQENAPIARDENGVVMTDKDGNPKPMYFGYGSGRPNYVFKGGDAIYEDINNDGVIDDLDIVYLGNINPKISGGFGLDLYYDSPIGRMMCKAFFNYRFGNKIMNIARMNAENMATNDNQSIATNWRWRKEGDVTEMPRAVYGDNAAYNYLGSDRFVEDGSFVRFKYLQFAYSVPPQYIKRYGLNQLSFNFNLNNVALWTKYTGVDPENLDKGNDKSMTPRSKDWTFGLIVGF